jgi:hypothetical protein
VSLGPPYSSTFPPEVLAALRRVLALAKGSPEFENAMADFMCLFGAHASSTGYAEGMKEGLVRGRRRAKGLPEKAKRHVRPMSTARKIRELLNAMTDSQEN